MSQIYKKDNTSTARDIETITGNSGGAVGPDTSYNIGFTASGGFAVTGNPGSFTLNMAPTGWTAGSVVFASAASVFSQDNANLFWDDASNFLGIGTNSPSAYLHVRNPATGPQVVSIFENSDVGAGTSEARIAFSTGGSYYGGIGTSFNSSVPRTTISTTAATSPNIWNPSFSVWQNNSASLGATYFNIQPPTSGLIVEGNTGIGISSPSSVSKIQIQSTSAVNTLLTGTQTLNDSGFQYGLLVNSNFSPAVSISESRSVSVQPSFVAGSGNTIGVTACFLSFPTYSSNVGTITNAIGVQILGGTTSTGTVTNSYGLYVEEPNHGTNVYTAYFESTVGIGTLIPFDTANLEVSSTKAVNTILSGTQTGNSASIQRGLWLQIGHNPAGSISVVRGISCEEDFIAQGGETVTDTTCIYTNPDFSSNVGTITTGIGIWIGSGVAEAGTVTNSYGLYCQEPAYGTNVYTAYFENKVGIGTTTPGVSAILDIQSTSQGVRFPNMTTTEKNAISSPAAGLVIYDTTLNKLCVYTTAWETITSV